MNPTSTLPDPSPQRRAFTLIEMIGVLAVIAILAAILIPTVMRQVDTLTSARERNSLASAGDALERSILRNRRIPSATDWASTVSTELGVNPANVATNAQRRPRLFLIDPAFRIGDASSGLPYLQSSRAFGSAIPPTSPRLILLSSIGAALPTAIVSGTASASLFNGVWDWDDAGSALPTGPDWTGWGGRVEDLKVHRVNLSPLFVRLVLSSYALVAANAWGRYSIDGGVTNNVPESALEGYFLQNSILSLITDSHANAGVLDSNQILIQTGSFVYDQAVWRSSLTGGSAIVAGMDFGSIVDKFLASYPNPGTTTTQQQVVQVMKEYMDAYEAWAATGFTSSALRSTAGTKQLEMMAAVSAMYNNTFPVACP